MSERSLIQRGLLRRAFRKHLRRAATQESQLIILTLDDETLFEVVYEAAMRNASSFAATTGAFEVTHDSADEAIVDNLLKLLRWFVTNGSQLVETIRIIVDLFGGVRPTTEVCEAETLFVE